MPYRPHLTNERREEFAQQVHEFREMFRLTQLQLAGYMGVSARTIRNIEAADVCPFPETELKFRKVESKFSRF